MVHRWPSTYNRGPDTILIVSFVLICVTIVAEIFYILYLKNSHNSVKKAIIKKGRLLQLVPVVTISTVTSTATNNAPYVLSTENQPTAPPISYQDPNSSRTYENKEVPPKYYP